MIGRTLANLCQDGCDWGDWQKFAKNLGGEILPKISPYDFSRLAQVHPESEEDIAEEEYQSTLYETLGTPSPWPVGQLFQGKASPRPSAATLPCFAHARGEEHDVKTCPYSHDPLVYDDAMRKRVEDTVNTLGKAWLQITIGELDAKSVKTPRYADSPVRSVIPAPREREFSGLYPSRTPGLMDESKQEGSRVQDYKEDT